MRFGAAVVAAGLTLMGRSHATAADDPQPVAPQAGVICQPNTGGANGLPDATYDSWKNINPDVSQFALVVGNDYHADDGALDVPALNNPHNDVQEMGNLLAEKGYAVVCLEDLSADDIVAAVDAFSVRWHELKENDEYPFGVIYFAGHGGETTSNQAFIVPARYGDDAIDGKPAKLMVNSLLALLPDKSDTGRTLPIVILDACRTKEALSATDFLGRPKTVNSDLTPFGDVKTQIQGVTSPVALVFSTSQGYPAGDGPAGKNQHGFFISAVSSELRKQPWDQVPHPSVSQFVDDLNADLQSAQIKQVPTEDAHKGDAGFLWRTGQGTNPLDVYAWRYGKLSGELADREFDDCPDVLTESDKLASMGQEWANKASVAFHKLHDNKCGTSIAAMDAHEAVASVTTTAMAGPVLLEQAAGSHGLTARIFHVAMHGAAYDRAAVPAKNLRIDPDVLSDMSDKLSDTAVGLRNHLAKVKLTASPRSGSAMTLSAEQFAQQGFKLDCKAGGCIGGQAFVSSSVSGQSGFVAANMLVRRTTKEFIAKFDRYAAEVSPKQLSRFEDFLTGMGKGDDRIVEISIIDTENDNDSFDFNDASPFIRYAQALVAKQLSIPTDRVVVLNGVQTDKEHKARCLSYSIQDMCFSVQIAMDAGG